MHFLIKPIENEEDWSFFYELSYQTLKSLRKSFYEQLVNDNPGKSDVDLLAAHRKEMEEYANFDNPRTRVFIAANDAGQNCGYLWMGERNSEDYWDFQKPQWIYDIVVDPRFRGHGLGKMLMKKAEEFAQEMHRDIGLFVHEDNTAAINLYKKEDYFVKCIPMSKKVAEEIPEIINDAYNVREAESKDISVIRELGLASYRRMVRISKDILDSQIDAKYDEYHENVGNFDRNRCTFVVESADERVIGFLVVAISGFSDKIAQIYDLGINVEYNDNELVKLLITKAESWSFMNGLSTLYYLLNMNDDVSQDSLQLLGFKVPGYFMEKDLFREVLT